MWAYTSVSFIGSGCCLGIIESWANFSIFLGVRRKESQGNGGANANSIVFNGYGSSKTRIKGSQKQKFHVSKGEDANENDVFLFFVVLECTHDHLTSVYTEFVSFIYFSFISFGVGLFLYENQENKKKQRYQLTYKIIWYFQKKLKTFFVQILILKCRNARYWNCSFFFKKKQSWWDNNNERIRD